MQSVVVWDQWADEARRLDADDPLIAFRDQFCLPLSPNGEPAIYLDGNSLGLLCHGARAAVERALDDWRDFAVEAWTEAAGPAPWFTLAETLGERVGAMLGAEPGSVVLTGSTTANLHQLLATYFDPNVPGRNRILCDSLNFPSDRYALESHLRLRGLNPTTHLVTVPSRDGWTIDEADFIAAMADDIQIAVLPSVLYVSGQLLDMPAVTRAAHARGVRVVWDCSHSVGTLPHQFDDWEVDFAFWCHYKYLNAGPGSVAGLYVNHRHWGQAPGMAGWWGSRKDRQFALAADFTPCGNAGALQIGTPPILSLAPLGGALPLNEAAGIARIRAKSLALTAFLRRVAEGALGDLGVACVTPVDDRRRGGHVALTHPDAARLAPALRAVGVTPDLRPPNVLRFAPVALYTSFGDCVTAMHRLHALLTGDSPLATATISDSRKLVT